MKSYSYLHFFLLFFFFFLLFRNRIQLRHKRVLQIIRATNRNPVQPINPTRNPDPQRFTFLHLHAHHRFDPPPGHPRSVHCHVINIQENLIKTRAFFQSTNVSLLEIMALNCDRVYVCDE